MRLNIDCAVNLWLFVLQKLSASNTTHFRVFTSGKSYLVFLKIKAVHLDSEAVHTFILII